MEVKIFRHETRYEARIIEGDLLPISTSVRFSAYENKLTALAEARRKAKMLINILAEKVCKNKNKFKIVKEVDREAETKKMTIRLDENGRIK
jgi:hypothetical protein